MKLQKILLETTSKTLIRKLVFIESKQNTIELLKTEITLEEKSIAEEIIGIISSNPQYPEFINILQMIVIIEENNPILIHLISNEISKSISKHFQIMQHYPDRLIESTLYEIPRKKVMDIFGSENPADISKELELLNKFLFEYGVRLKYVNHLTNGNIRFSINIFPED